MAFQRVNYQLITFLANVKLLNNIQIWLTICKTLQYFQKGLTHLLTESKKPH